LIDIAQSIALAQYKKLHSCSPLSCRLP